MTKDFQVERLDVPAFAAAGATLTGQVPMARLDRLAAECETGASSAVDWEAAGELRDMNSPSPQQWVRLRARAELARTCQRCLRPMMVELMVDRWFRFVADEATASALDDEMEDDILVSSRSLDLIELLEDELLLAMPLVPRHEVCPEPSAGFSAGSAQSAADERPHPFAALAKMRLNR